MDDQRAGKLDLHETCSCNHDQIEGREVFDGHFCEVAYPSIRSVYPIFSVFNVGCNRSTEAAREGDRLASECAQSELVRQCPPNTTPLLEADAKRYAMSCKH